MTSPTAFEITLHARNQATRCARSYRITAGPHLFGRWLVAITYGRIGATGRALNVCATDEADARNIVRRRLKRRTTAPKRIGVPYKVLERYDPDQWLADPRRSFRRGNLPWCSDRPHSGR